MTLSKTKTARWSSRMTEDRKEAEVEEEVPVSLEKKATDPKEPAQRKPLEEPRNSLKS